jgi:hypothetical protein
MPKSITPGPGKINLKIKMKKFKLLIKNKKNQHTFLSVIIFICLIFGIINLFYVHARQSINFDAPTLIQKSTLFLSPRTATILEGSTIEISVFINTENTSINTVQLDLTFDPTKMIIISPSNANSSIGIFIDPPTFSNTKGTLNLSGVITNGIKTKSGLLTTITFKAISTGRAVVSISQSSKVLANDGLGTEVETQFDRGNYDILPVPPAGPKVFSETHPFQNLWYNNNNPQVAWDKDPGVTDFSYILDDKPFTVPDNDVDSTSKEVSYQDLSDGVRYFHIKAKKQGVWGQTTNFLIRIDTAPPAEFKPKFQLLTASSTNGVIVSFFTADNLSGLDHYEVGVLSKNRSPDELPIFQQSDSPYQFLLPQEGARVTVREFDGAGNSIDESIDITSLTGIYNFLKQNYIIIILLIVIFFHLLFGHKIIPHLRRIIKAVRKEGKEIKEEEMKIN